MDIPTFTTRLNIESYKEQEYHRWVKYKTYNKVRDGGSCYLVTSIGKIDGYTED